MDISSATQTKSSGASDALKVAAQIAKDEMKKKINAAVAEMKKNRTNNKPGWSTKKKILVGSSVVLASVVAYKVLRGRKNG